MNVLILNIAILMAIVVVVGGFWACIATTRAQEHFDQFKNDFYVPKKQRRKLMVDTSESKAKRDADDPSIANFASVKYF